MKLFPKAAALLMACSLLAGCETTRVAVPLKPPADRMDCQMIEGRPVLPAEYQIDWSKVTTVPQAKTEHEAYVVRARERDAIVAGYIVEIEGRLWACSNDDQWLRDFFDALPDD